MRFKITKVALILVIVMFDMISIFGQTYTTYYYDNNVSGKINSISRIIDYKTRKMNELRFYNDGISSCTIVGYVRIRYTEINSGRTDYKEERFKLFLGAGKDETVDFYFKPSWSRSVGIYEPIGFYVERHDCDDYDKRNATTTTTTNTSIDVSTSMNKERQIDYSDIKSFLQGVIDHPNTFSSFLSIGQVSVQFYAPDKYTLSVSLFDSPNSKLEKIGYKRDARVGCRKIYSANDLTSAVKDVIYICEEIYGVAFVNYVIHPGYK